MKANSITNSKPSLQFTGNWFIDAGILGFVNLMEKIYGWDLNTLQKRIKENEELVYYGYFPFAYFMNNLRIILNENDLKEVIQHIQKEKDNEKIFEEAWEFIDKFSKNFWIRKKLSDLDKLSKQREDLKDDIESIKNLLKQLTSKKKELKKIFPNRRNLEIRSLSQFNVLLDEVKKNKLESNLDKEFFSLIQKIERKEKELYSKLAKLWDNKNKNLSFFRIPITERFFINFLIFQTGGDYTYSKQKEDLLNIIKFNLEKRGILKKFDRTVNKFLVSGEKMTNIFYTFPLNMKNIKEVYPYFYVYLLCFPLAFVRFGKKYYLFYSPEIKFCYYINKRLKYYFEKIKEKGRGSFIKITYRAILDVLVEQKSIWSLENMYIVSYSGISRDTQEPQNVEFIGIPKLQASVLLDDTIRENLNRYLQIRGKNFKGNRSIWLLEEFIKGKPLYPLALQHVKLRLSGDIKRINYSIFYAILLDVTISEFGKKEKETLFSKSFFQTNYREILKKVKDEFRSVYHYSTNETKRLIPGGQTRERIAYLLLDSLYGNDKARFLNILLKSLNNSKDIINRGFLNMIFEKIMNYTHPKGCGIFNLDV